MTNDQKYKTKLSALLKIHLNFKAFLVLLILILGIYLFSKIQSFVFAQDKDNAGNISVPSGYSVKTLVAGLNGPTVITFDSIGNLYVAESGLAGAGEPKILKVDQEGNILESLKGFEAPISGLAFSEDRLYVSQRGKISVIEENGKITDLVTDLPSQGDYSNNQLIIDKDKNLYFTQGTVTNAGVVGDDNLVTGWLKGNQKLADIPCQSIFLNGIDYATEKNITGAFVPDGTATKEGQEVESGKLCNGAIYRLNLENPEELQVVAWGIRNPLGINQNSEGKIFFTEQGFDLRGRRLIANSKDNFYELSPTWYGWPDYSGGEPVSLAKFRPEGGYQPQFVLQEHPGEGFPPTPLAQFDSYSRSAGFTFGPEKFGFKDQVFVALSGNIQGLTDNTEKNVGYKVVRLDVNGRKIIDFAVSKAVKGQVGPASRLGKPGLERPMDVKFSPNNEMYVADFGVLEVREGVLKAQPETGVIWKISKSGFGFGVNFLTFGILLLGVGITALVGYAIFRRLKGGGR
jgi:glucose/arabinose dehydrogenase